MRDEDDDGGGGRAVCRIGNHTHPGDSSICDRHLDGLHTQLAGVARYTRRLTFHLVPGTTPAGDKIATSRIGSPTSARLDALNAVGPGGRETRRDARALHPQIRQWSTRVPYQVQVIRDAALVTVTRHVTGWHSQLVTDGIPQPTACRCGRIHDTDTVPTGTAASRPLLVLDDDQIGLIPPAEWADEWVRRWRIALGATTSPIRGRVDLACDADQRHRLHRARIAESLRAARQSPALMPAVAQLIVMQRTHDELRRLLDRHVANALVGVRDDGTAHQQHVTEALDGGRLGAARILHDPVAAEWAVRYGHAETAAAAEIDCHRLAGWLELAADTDDPDDRIDLPRFAAELRSLHAQLAHIVGDITDEQWLGRCPALLRDRDGNDTDRPCGHGLWQDPYRDLIECARCRSTWPPKDWIGLAALIRTRWPIDRRRRYTQADCRDAETNPNLPRCTGCLRPMKVEWRDCTGRLERTRFWTPAALTCPAGCLAGTTAAAAG